jgi:ribosomal protein L37E
MGIERLRYGHRAFMFIGSRTRSWVEKGKEARVAKVIERVEARYEVQDVEMGKVYKWRPERIVLECRCGHRLSLNASKTSCAECGTDYEQAVKEASADGHQNDQTLHPWRYSSCSEGREDGRLPF